MAPDPKCFCHLHGHACNQGRLCPLVPNRLPPAPPPIPRAQLVKRRSRCNGITRVILIVLASLVSVAAIVHFAARVAS